MNTTVHNHELGCVCGAREPLVRPIPLELFEAVYAAWMTAHRLCGSAMGDRMVKMSEKLAEVRRV